MRARTFRALALLMPLLAIGGLAMANARTDFLAAERAYASGDRPAYESLKRRLAGYPLYPYLEYRELRNGLGSASAATVERFLDRFPDTPLAQRLRNAWLERLAKEKRWTEYVRFFDPEERGTTRRCHYLRALIATGRKTQAFPQVDEIWLHGQSQPDACDPVFDEWRTAGKLTPQLVWARIALAMDAGSIPLARYLGRYLPAADRPWVERWLDVQRSPAKWLAGDRLAGDHPIKKAIVADGVRRLASSDHNLAVSLWQRYRRELGYSEAEACPVDERLAIILEDEPDALAYRFFQGIEACHSADRLQEARIRAALMRQDWGSVARWIAEFPEKQQASERWLYWKGRAMEAMGHKEQAEALYRAAAAERTYYGFLAADRIGVPYRYDHTPITVPADVLKRVAALPAMERMEELYALDRIIDARREWFFMVKRLDNAGLRAAASIFHRWGWQDRAIFTAARADYWDDLELRFPLEYSDLVARYARDRDLDPSWVFGVLRQESAFMTDVRSGAGAIGLMQLMPDTAKLVAREYRIPRPSSVALTDPGTNIALGTGYLRMMLDELADHPVLATAAYNAGPHRVKRWMPSSTLDADIWVELIPFRETRQYVQRVMAYAAIYDQRRGTRPVRLSERMRKVTG